MEETIVIMDYREEDINFKDPFVTIPYLSTYEYNRLIEVRVKQLNNGSKPTVKIGNLKNTVDIARKEIRMKKIPLILRRTLPGGKYEDWKIDELFY